VSENDKDKEIAELRTQLAEMKAAVIMLQRQINPPPRPVETAKLQGHSPDTYRYLDQVGVSKQVFNDLVANVDEDVVRQLRTDGKR